MSAKPTVSILLRLPTTLAFKIRKEARETPISGNSLIIKALEQYFEVKSNLESQKQAIAKRLKGRQ